jgi:hypothetical protein
MRKFQKLALANAALFIAAGCLASAQAAEHVYLRSGFDLVCDHQANLDGQVRLYLTPSDDSYLDVTVGDIIRQEAVHVESVDASIGLQQTTPASLTILPVPVSMDLQTLLGQAGAEHHLDPDLLASVVRAESGGHARAVSPVGARGLMQLMPGTAADLGVRDSFAPEQNVAGGATYLDALLMYYHENLALALAAYNAGPAAVDRYGRIPPYAETRRYVERVIHDYNRQKLREARRRPSHTTPESISALPGSSIARQGSAMATIVTHP